MVQKIHLHSTIQMFDDLSAIYFEIPARDALGRQHVTGKLLAAKDKVRLYWKLKNNTFKKAGEEMQTIEIEYDNIESAEIKSTLGLFKHRLILKVSDPRPLQDIPGTDVGRATLMLMNKNGRLDARRFIKLVDYRKSEAEATQMRSRLSDLENQTPGSL